MFPFLTRRLIISSLDSNQSKISVCNFCVFLTNRFVLHTTQIRFQYFLAHRGYSFARPTSGYKPFFVMSIIMSIVVLEC